MVSKKIFLASVIMVFIVPACTPVKTIDLTPLQASVTSLPTVNQTRNPGTSIPYPPPVTPQNSFSGSSTPYPPPVSPFPTFTLTATATPTITFTPTLIRPTPTLPPSLASLKIAFCNNNKLWLWQNGNATPLTDVDGSCWPRISSDGKEIAFMQGGLWVINSNGTDKRNLIGLGDLRALEPTDPGVSLLQFEWIPNTHNLLFNTRLNFNYGLWYTDDLYLVNADLQQWSKLRKQGEGGGFYLSPDGKQVALVTPQKISVMRFSDGKSQTLLDYSLVSTASEYNFYAHPVWSIDSQSLMVSIPPSDAVYGTQSQTKIWCLFVDGSQPALVAQLPANRTYFISPDFSKIASFVRLNQMPDNYEFHISQIDGSEDTVYLKGDLYFETWAPDSERFVINLYDSTGLSLGEEGKTLIPLTERFINGSFSWIDDTHYIFLNTDGYFEHLNIGTVGEPSILVAAEKTVNQAIGYDFVK